MSDGQSGGNATNLLLYDGFDYLVMKSIVDRISVLGSAIIGCTQQVLFPQFVLLVFKSNDRLIRYYPGFGRAVENQWSLHFYCQSFSISYDFSRLPKTEI